MAPDLERLRRFSLAIGLALIVYLLAGIELEAGAKISVLGLPFIIRRPELLSAGLMLASIYGLARFYYYGFMLAHSPHRRRKDVLHQLHGHGGYGTYKGSVFWGPAVYSITPWTSNRDAAEAQLNQVISAFPKVWRVRPIGTIKTDQSYDENGESHVSYSAEITIPLASRVTAILHDLDYSLPLWVNFFALGLAAVTMWA